MPKPKDMRPLTAQAVKSLVVARKQGMNRVAPRLYLRIQGNSAAWVTKVILGGKL